MEDTVGGLLGLRLKLCKALSIFASIILLLSDGQRERHLSHLNPACEAKTIETMRVTGNTHRIATVLFSLFQPQRIAIVLFFHFFSQGL